MNELTKIQENYINERMEGYIKGGSSKSEKKAAAARERRKNKKYFEKLLTIQDKSIIL